MELISLLSPRLCFQDNRSLKEQNDELNGQIINLSIQGAKNLMTAPFSDSLAAEINSVSRGEVGCPPLSVSHPLEPSHALPIFLNVSLMHHCFFF